MAFWVLQSKIMAVHQKGWAKNPIYVDGGGRVPRMSNKFNEEQCFDGGSQEALLLLYNDRLNIREMC